MDFEEVTIEFFKNRFPEKVIEFEKKCGYFDTWKKRFENGNPEIYMDKQSLFIWK